MRFPPECTGLPPIRSETQTWTAGGQYTWKNWLPSKGLRGGRNVIDAIVLRIVGTITVTTATQHGADLWRLLRSIQIEDRAGQPRWDLDGYMSRIASILLGGIMSHQEHTTLSVGAAQAVNLFVVIPFTIQGTKRGYDFSLPVDEFRAVKVGYSDLAGVSTGGAGLNTPALQIYLTVYGHEEGDEDGGSLEFKVPTLVRSTAFTNNTQVRLAPKGLLHNVIVVRSGNTTAAGEVITGITDVRSVDLGFPLTDRGELVHRYRYANGLAASGPTTAGTERFFHPVLTGTALPLLESTTKTSAAQGALLEQVMIDVGTGAADLHVITRETIGRDDALVRMTENRHKISPGMSVRMKTLSKSQRDPSAWPARKRAFLPVSVAYNPQFG